MVTSLAFSLCRKPLQVTLSRIKKKKTLASQPWYWGILRWLSCLSETFIFLPVVFTESKQKHQGELLQQRHRGTREQEPVSILAFLEHPAWMEHSPSGERERGKKKNPHPRPTHCSLPPPWCPWCVLIAWRRLAPDQPKSRNERPVEIYVRRVRWTR